MVLGVDLPHERQDIPQTSDRDPTSDGRHSEDAPVNRPVDVNTPVRDVL